VRVVIAACSVVGAALKADSIPRRALLIAREQHVIVLSTAVFEEIAEVLRRPKFASMLTPDRQDEILALLTVAAAWGESDVQVSDCRDAKDNREDSAAARVARRGVGHWLIRLAPGACPNPESG
jgi:putative PIN family toxin of toxin-antitoxin system